MEEFVTEEEEPWYDQQDLEQGELSAQRSAGDASLSVREWRILATLEIGLF